MYILIVSQDRYLDLLNNVLYSCRRNIGGRPGRWIYNYICNQCLSPLKLWVRISLMARCNQCNIMSLTSSVTCCILVVFSGFYIVIYKVERSRPRSYGIRIYIYTGIQFLSLLRMIFRFAPFAKRWGTCGV
jgi:hypothetical protein